MKKIYILLLVFIITDVSAFAETSSYNKDLFSKDFEYSLRRNRLQNTFIHQIALDWVTKNKRLPTQEDIESKNLTGLQLQSNYIALISIKNEGIIGLFDSLQHLREKIMSRIKKLGIKSKYPFLYPVSLTDDFTITETDILSNSRRNELQLYIIDKFILPWMDKTDRIFPSIMNFNKTPYGVGITLKLVIPTRTASDIGIFDSMFHLKELTYFKIKELGLEDKYPLFCKEYRNEKLFNDLIEGKDLTNPEIKKQVQILLIEQLILPWIKTNGRVPYFKDFGVKEGNVGIYYHRLFTQPISLEIKDKFFNSLNEFKQIILDYLQTNNLSSEYLRTENTSSLNSLNSKIYIKKSMTPEEKKNLRRDFIIKHIIPWIKEQKQLPNPYYDFGEKEDHVQIAFTKLCSTANSTLFENIYDLNSEILKTLKSLELDELLETVFKHTIFQKKVRLDFTDIELKEILQNIFIRTYMIPWVNKYKRFPLLQDYGYDKDQVGISHLKLFREQVIDGRSIPSLFDSSLEIKNKTYLLLAQDKMKTYYESISTETEEKYKFGKRILDYGISQTDLTILSRKKTLQKIFITQYVFPYKKKNNGKIIEKDDFGTSYDKIGLPYEIVFGEIINKEHKTLGLFNSLKELNNLVSDCSYLFIDEFIDDNKENEEN